jgi:monothiol glutaredoxin
MSSANERIQALITNTRVLVFMKGNRAIPMCGFSATVVQVLDRLGATYETVDVLEDPEIREGVKAFSNWPTIPQVYIDGKFIGGCDIVRDMYQRGELEPLVRATAAAS